MRIADVAELYSRQGGGVKTYVEAKLAAGKALGVDVTIVAPGPEDAEEPREGGRILWVKSPPIPMDPRYFLFASKRRLHAALDRAAPDLVEGSSVWGGAWMAASYPSARARALVFHQDPVAALLHPTTDHLVSRRTLDRLAFPAWKYLQTLAQRYDRTVVAGAWLAERLSSFGVPRVEAVPFGIDLSLFRAARAQPELRAEWLAKLGLEPSARLLVAVSRHHPEKRLPVLIEAVRALGPGVGLVIFGDGPDRRRVERAAAKCDRVCLAGYTSHRAELAAVVASADAFVHGSAAETFGMVIAEALAAGTPVITPDSGGAAELATPEVGETYPTGDVAGCADAIRRLLDRELDALSAAAQAASEHVRSLDTHFEDLFARYEALARHAASP